MAALTRSSRGAPNGRAGASVVVGLLAAAALPAAVAAAEYVARVDLLEAAVAIPVAAVLGVAALVLARGARKRIERTVGRVGGRRLAAVGRALGLLGLCLATSGAIAVATYYALVRWAE